MIIFFVVVCYLAFVLIQPYIAAILTSVILAYIFYPLQKHLSKKIKYKRVSAITITIFILLLLIIPIAFVLNALTQEAYYFFTVAKQKVLTGDLIGVECEGDNMMCMIATKLNEFTSSLRIKYFLSQVIQRGSNFLIDSISDFVVSIPGRLVELFIVFFVLYYLLVEGKTITKKVEELVPLDENHKRPLLKQMKGVTYAVIYGYIITAMIQGFLAGIGFYIFGIKSPILWGIVTAFAALLPFIGTAIVWAPIGLFMILAGLINGSAGNLGRGIGLLLYGVLIIGTIDNIVRPKIIGDKAQIHPIIVLVGVLGGLKLFGFVGIIVGPLILTTVITFIEIYEGHKISNHLGSKEK